MKTFFIACVFIIAVFHHPGEITAVGSGRQPQLTVDRQGIVRLVYGNGDAIFYAVSHNEGRSFSEPASIAEVEEMHLGRSRGPQLATSANFSLVTAIGKKGNIQAFLLDHKKHEWTVIKNVNDESGSAAEGLMGIVADASDNFYAVWLDSRGDGKNKIAFSTLKRGTASWTKNRIIYKSPEGTVCPCCKPSVAVKGNTIALMFRNLISGSRDLYLITSNNGGKNFGEAIKLGNGTWKLNGCPMDGGGMVMNAGHTIHTLWQRDGKIYYAQPDHPEVLIAEGSQCSLAGNENLLMTWQAGNMLHAKFLKGKIIDIDEGTALRAVVLKDQAFLAAWEKDGQIFSGRF